METVDIVHYEQRMHDKLIGYRQNNAVVYASVPSNLDDTRAKQVGYEQVRTALAYEQALDKPSIDGSAMEPIEVFTPAEPVTTRVKINGPSIVAFDDESADKTITYMTIAYDQYGDEVSSQTIEQPFNNTDSNETVTATIDGVSTTLNVIVQAYREMEPSEIDILTNYVLDVDMRLVMVEMGLI